MPEALCQRVYRLRLLFLHLSGQKRTDSSEQTGARFSEAANERKGGEEIMSPTKVINGPHLRTAQTTRNIMLHVSISLVPALLEQCIILESGPFI